MSNFFGFDFNADHDEYAEEGFIVEVQYEISKLLKIKGISRSAFAKSMGVSPAYVSQMLGDEGANLTCRTIAKAFIALGEVPAIRTKASLSHESVAAIATVRSENASIPIATPDNADWASVLTGAQDWQEGEVNDQEVPPSNDDGWGNVIFLRRAA